MAEATEVQYSEKHGSVVRVSDPLLAYEIAQELHDHKEATEYWVKAADQARLKAATLNDQLLSTDVDRIKAATVAHDLALEINGWRNKFELARRSYSTLSTQRDDDRENGRQAVRKAELELAKYREQVREVAIRVAEDQGWCRDGLNETLEELGLKKFVKKYLVTVQVKVLVEDPDVDDDYDARSEAQDFVDNQVGNGSNDHYTVESVEYTDVEEVDE